MAKKKADPTPARPVGAQENGPILLQKRQREHRREGWKIVERFVSIDAALHYAEAQTDRREFEYQVKPASK